MEVGSEERDGKRFVTCSDQTFLDRNLSPKRKLTCINFMPFDPYCFTTGGEDGSVVAWKEEAGVWKTKSMYQHVNVVYGVAGLFDKTVVISAAADKKTVGVDVTTGVYCFVRDWSVGCLDVLANPKDYNLLAVHTRESNGQIRLCDYRTPKYVVHSLGWEWEKPDTKEMQSILTKQSWSPNGLMISSGSYVDRAYIFDIRKASFSPTSALSMHLDKVYKAEWHPTASIDLNR